MCVHVQYVHSISGGFNVFIYYLIYFIYQQLKDYMSLKRLFGVSKMFFQITISTRKPPKHLRSRRARKRSAHYYPTVRLPARYLSWRLFCVMRGTWGGLSRNRFKCHVYYISLVYGTPCSNDGKLLNQDYSSYAFFVLIFLCIKSFFCSFHRTVPFCNNNPYPIK